MTQIQTVTSYQLGSADESWHVGDVRLFLTPRQPSRGNRVYGVRRRTRDGNVRTVGERCQMTRPQAIKALRVAVRDEIADARKDGAPC